VNWLRRGTFRQLGRNGAAFRLRFRYARCRLFGDDIERGAVSREIGRDPGRLGRA
jgi:hypothetical protein